MFVARNAWSELRRHPWRTALTMIVGLLMAVWSVFGAAVLHEYGVAHTTDYDRLRPQAVVRMTDATAAARKGDDPDWTSRYLSWDDYNTIGTAAQAKNIQFDYSVAVSVPVRQSASLKPIVTDATDDAPADRTGGDFTLQSFYNEQAVIANPYGAFKVVEGDGLGYQDVTAHNVLVSKKLAELNGLKVGDEVTVGDPTDAKRTCTYTVGGVYEYTDDPRGVEGADAPFAKDDRDNVLYTTYYSFATDGLDTTTGSGWSVPDLDIVFSFADPQTYDRFADAVRSTLPDGYTVGSPTITDYLDSLAPLDSLATTTRIMLVCVWSVGGALLLALALLEALPRRDEIGFALMTGVTKGRLAWQFMLEILMQTVPMLALGLIIGGWSANPLATPMAGDHAVGMHAAILWRVAWIGLLACLALAAVAGARVALFRTPQLFASPYLEPADPATPTADADDPEDEEHR